ncbi:adenylyltransferase/cytidyltransferase family protein [Arenibacter algicola]|uniref:adenylyltransferase/cytidyltransferase family protein n=1 Tax=Arenibacter algicola TaxID=616991 RepID=UPI0009FCA6FA|nr:adenylyltransferase/cytidyltransferase family protein [Arenibacter algicola]
MVRGITFGKFDLLYCGYVEMLKEAKKKCDYLIVGLQSNSNSSLEIPMMQSTLLSLEERYADLSDCEFVDEIITYTTEEELESILRSANVDIRIIGEEYRHLNFTGRLYCEKRGIEIYYNPRVNKLPFIYTTKISTDINNQESDKLHNALSFFRKSFFRNTSRSKTVEQIFNVIRI